MPGTRVVSKLPSVFVHTTGSSRLPLHVIATPATGRASRSSTRPPRAIGAAGVCTGIARRGGSSAVFAVVASSVVATGVRSLALVAKRASLAAAAGTELVQPGPPPFGAPSRGSPPDILTTSHSAIAAHRRPANKSLVFPDTGSFTIPPPEDDEGILSRSPPRALPFSPRPEVGRNPPRLGRVTASRQPASRTTAQMYRLISGHSSF